MTRRPNRKPDFISDQVRDGRYYFFDLTPGPTTGLAVVCGGWEACSPAYHNARDDFPYLSLEFVAAGRGRLVLAGERHVLRAGDLFHYGPGVPHEIHTSAAEPLEKYFVDFVGDAAERLLHGAPFNQRQPLQVPDPTVIRSLFEDLHTDGTSASSRAARLCAVTVELLLLRVAETGANAEGRRSLARESYERCRQYIVDHCLEIPALDVVSRQCGIDKAYLCRLFQRFSRETPYRLLTRLKMARAAELLLHSDRLAKDIAGVVGFADPYHFSKTFKRVHGLSPAAFRERGYR